MNSKIFLFVVVCVVALILCGCGETKYINRTKFVRDTTYIVDVFHDSVIKLDSIYIKEKNDTIYEYRYKYIDHYVRTSDTAYISRTDTVRVIEEAKVVEKVGLSFFDWLKYVVITLLLCAISFVAGKLF